MYRKNVEQVWLAMHDPLNIWGTALRYHIDPRFARHGGEFCLRNFLELAGALFNEEFERGLR
jgi:hypothetical protein